MLVNPTLKHIEIKEVLQNNTQVSDLAIQLGLLAEPTQGGRKTYHATFKGELLAEVVLYENHTEFNISVAINYLSLTLKDMADYLKSHFKQIGPYITQGLMENL